MKNDGDADKAFEKDTHTHTRTNKQTMNEWMDEMKWKWCAAIIFDVVVAVDNAVAVAVVVAATANAVVAIFAVSFKLL